MPHLARLPIPKAHIPAAVPAHDELPIGTHAHIDRVPRIVMAAEALLPILPEAIRGRVHDDLVVARLERDVFPRRVRGGAHEGVHVGLGDELDGDGDVVLPGAEGLVVGGGDEAAVVVDEGDGVDGAEVVVVFLRHFAGAGVELDDLLVGHAGEEFVGGGLGWVEADDVGDFAGAEAGYAFPVFGVPEFHLSVVGGGEEGCAGGGEAGVGDGFCVSGEGAEEGAGVVDVPKFEVAVGGGGEEEVSRGGEEAQGGDGFGVGFPGVDLFLRDVVLLGAGLFAQVDVEVLRDVHVGAALIVEFGAAVEGDGFGGGGGVGVGGAGGGEGGHRGWDEGFFDVFFIRGELFAGYGGFILVALVFVFVAGPWPFVGAFTVNDTGITFLLSLGFLRC